MPQAMSKQVSTAPQPPSPPMEEGTFRVHIAKVQVPLAMLDFELRPIEVSEGWRAAGFAADDLLSVGEHFVGDALAAARERCLLGETINCELQSRDPRSGGVRWWRAALMPWPAEGVPRRLLLNAREVTDVVLARFAAEQAHQRLSMALKLGRSLVHEVNLSTGEVTLSSTCPDLERFHLGASPMAGAHPDDRVRVAKAYEACARDGRSFHLRYRLGRDDKTETWMEAIGERFSDLVGADGRVVTVLRDITEQILQHQKIEALAYRDTLTQLANRAAFQMALADAIAASESHGEGFALIMIDVDYFKQVNDTLGHDAGDALLAALAGQLRRAFRQSDTVARLGGDEFAVLLRDIKDLDVLVRPIEALEQLLQTPFLHAGQTLKISTSIGAAFHGPGSQNPEHVLKNADLALYQAKSNGRGRNVLFHPDMRTEVEERLQLLRDVRIGLAERQFELFYQPIIDIVDNRVEGFEALMRWRHPHLGLVGPEVFGVAFDDTEFGPLLGEFALDAALEKVREWLDAGLAAPRVSINVSAAQLRGGRLVQDTVAKLARWSVPASALAIEVTEGPSGGGADTTIVESIRELAALGIQVSLDNFGACDGSTGNLRHYPINALKISKLLIANGDGAALRSVLSLGRALGVQVVADGVESEAQAQSLRDIGCSRAQGFHFARPMTADEVGPFMRNYADKGEATAPDL